MTRRLENKPGGEPKTVLPFHYEGAGTASTLKKLQRAKRREGRRFVTRDEHGFKQKET
jgi:hypothetical protein